MKSARMLRKKIDGNELTLGVLVTMHFWLDLIEIARNAGLDYVILDGEHAALDGEKLADACALGRMLDFPVLIRPPESQYTPIRLAADAGACGFLLPQVRGLGTMDEIRDALCMAPRGKRRPGGRGNRWVSDYQYQTWKTEVEDDFIVLPQIESREGLANAEAIARHELTTALAVGPYDLSADLGVCWQPDHPTLVGALDRIRTAARAAGKNTWMIGDAPTLRQRGFTFLCLAEPSFLLEATLKNMVSALRAGGGAAASKSDRPLP